MQFLMHRSALVAPPIRGAALLFTLVAGLLACDTFAYVSRNDPLRFRGPAGESYTGRASLEILRDRGEDGVLTILALSGGGSRAANFSAEVMLALQERGVLQRIDAITPVSGGGLPAAYYVLSLDPPEGLGGAVTDNPLYQLYRFWEADTVRTLMRRNYINRWAYNCAAPQSICLLQTTSYDRTDVLAETFADELYDNPLGGFPYRLRDLNPERPYLILNTTNATRGEFGRPFTFTHEDFTERLNSDVSSYPLAWAVAASAAFPGPFNYHTLRDYRPEVGGTDADTEDRRYLHLTDGGVDNNIASGTVERLLRRNYQPGASAGPGKPQFDRAQVILVDAYIENRGVSDQLADPREQGLGGGFDSGPLDAVDILFRAQYEEQLAGLRGLSRRYAGLEVIEFNFRRVRDDLPKSGALSQREALELYERLNRISTSFSITQEGAEDLRVAAELLTEREAWRWGAAPEQAP